MLVNLTISFRPKVRIPGQSVQVALYTVLLASSTLTLCTEHSASVLPVLCCVVLRRLSIFL